ncbi:MAG TPA: tetratricopeptide repeat protein [Chthoniobacterales bacterium]|nr:tetratricopeptide repeat protein [Chthoniobacterales bacterium]
MKPFLLGIALVASVLISYAPALHNGFVWDDTALILRDPLIRSWRLIPEGFNHYLFTDAAASDFYRPLQRLTYTIEYALFVARPGPYHLTSILIHAAAAIALVLFAQTLLEAFGCEKCRARWVAFFAALIWAIHPVHSSAVVYVSGRADPLAALFGFTGGYLVLRSIVRQGRQSITLLLCGAAAFLCSALSKESGFVFPLLTILLLVILKRYRAVFRLGVATLFIAVIYFSLRLPAEHNVPSRFGTRAPLSVRPIIMARAVAEYAGLLVLPVNLHMERDVNAPFTGNLQNDTVASAARELQTLVGIAISAGFLIWLVRSRLRNPALFALLVCAAATYLPISGVMRLNASVAEHWLYIPSAFLFAALTLVASDHGIRVLRPTFVRRAAGVLGAAWILFFGVRTFARAFDWKDQRTFLERTIADGGDSVRMLVNLGSLESSEDRLDLAEKHLSDALKREPDHPFAVVDLAAVHVKQNEFDTARRLLGRATQMPAVAAKAHELLAIIEGKQHGRADLMRLRLAAHTGFSNWAIERRYIKLLAETGAVAAAVQELRTCLQTEWYRAESWQLLAELLAKNGQNKAAAEAMTLAGSFDVHLSARPTAL